MKYKTGDKVRIVNYGHRIFSNMNGKFEIIDISAELVGMEGIIKEGKVTQDRPSYVLDGIPNKCAWYDEEQLEMISPNPNTL